jgi:hypothetical protein
VISTTKQQRCWVHKTAHVLDKLPNGTKPQAKKMLHNTYNAEHKADRVKFMDDFAYESVIDLMRKFEDGCHPDKQAQRQRSVGLDGYGPRLKKDCSSEVSSYFNNTRANYPTLSCALKEYSGTIE